VSQHTPNQKTPRPRIADPQTPFRRYELGRPAANTKLCSGNQPLVRPVRCRGGNMKFRALRLDAGNFSWGSEAVTRKARVLDVKYNASNNELVRHPPPSRIPLAPRQMPAPPHPLPTRGDVLHAHRPAVDRRVPSPRCSPSSQLEECQRHGPHWRGFSYDGGVCAWDVRGTRADVHVAGGERSSARRRS
jgi:hypothetical protein